VLGFHPEFIIGWISTTGAGVCRTPRWKGLCCCGCCCPPTNSDHQHGTHTGRASAIFHGGNTRRHRHHTGIFPDEIVCNMSH